MSSLFISSLFASLSFVTLLLLWDLYTEAQPSDDYMSSFLGVFMLLQFVVHQHNQLPWPQFYEIQYIVQMSKGRVQHSSICYFLVFTNSALCSKLEEWDVSCYVSESWFLPLFKVQGPPIQWSFSTRITLYVLTELNLAFETGKECIVKVKR